MSSNTNTSRYKQVNRQARIQTREGAFSKGMMYTNKPLAEGYNKLLVNYDVDPLDGTLRTRKGLQTTGLYAIGGHSTNVQLFNMEKGFTNIIAGNTRGLGKDYRVNTAKNSEITADIVTYNTLTNALNVVSLAGMSDEDKNTVAINATGTKQYPIKAPYSVQPLCGGEGDLYQVYPHTLLDPGIHGQKCCHDIHFKKPIGTFAFGNAYYAFSKHQVKAVEKPTGTVNLIPFPYTLVTDKEYTSGRFKYKVFENAGIAFAASSNGWDYPSIILVTKFNLPAGSYVGSFWGYGTASSWRMTCDGYTFKPGEITEVTLPIIDKPLYLHCPWNSLTDTLSQDHSVRPQIELYNTSVSSPYYTEYVMHDAEKAHTLLYGSDSDYIVDELHAVQYYTDEDVPRSLIATHGDFEPAKTVTGSLYDICVEPQQLNPAEAVSAGYNMLLEDPYKFVCESGATIEILGVLPYHPVYNSILPNVLVNQEIILKCFYRAPTSSTKQYRVVWEWREVGATNWNVVQDTKVNFSEYALTPLTCPFRSAVEQCIIKITITDPSNTVTQADGTSIEYVESTQPFGFNFHTTTTASNQNATLENYDLSTAQGMLEWKNRLVLWGVSRAETILFTSDVNNPSYFPYPNNIDIFDEPIIHCMLYGDDLVIFTNTKLYRLTIGETGGIGAHTLVQKNLNIVEKDLPMFCTVRNMLFFKSGNYYYMLVPKSTSITGETTIAPVSNTINYFLDNFNNEVEKLFKIYTQGKTVTDPQRTWAHPFTSYLENYYAYTDNATVVLNFVYDYSGFIKGRPDYDTGSQLVGDYKEDLHYWETPDWAQDLNKEYTYPVTKRCLILSLIYNTETYAWSIKIYETPNVPHPVYQNALGQQHYMYITTQELGTYPPGPLFVQCTKQATEDNLVIYQNGLDDGVYDYDSIDSINPTEHYITHNTHPIQKNYQYLDTGYRVLTSSVDIKKRFREVQFSIDNVSQKALTFYTAFIVDGNLRKDMQGYVTKMVTDPDDPSTGILIVERPYVDAKYIPDYVIKVDGYVSPDVTPGDTTLNDTFVLDNTQLPDLAYWKIRVDVSGKGYTPRLQILSVNDEDYSILSTNWVYRTMNSR